jgi:hypothetical protein
MKSGPGNLIEALRFACDGAPHRAEERRGEGASVAGAPMGDKRRAVEPWRPRHAQRPSARRFFSRGNWGVGGTKPESAHCFGAIHTLEAPLRIGAFFTPGAPLCSGANSATKAPQCFGAVITPKAPLRIGAFITPGALLCFGVLAFEVTARGFGVEGEGERL